MDLALNVEGGVKSLLNMRSRNLKDLQVDPHSLSESELAQLMSDNPKTMIRPLYLKGDVLVVGYDEAKLESLLSCGS